MTSSCYTKASQCVLSTTLGGVSDPFCYVEVDKKRMRTDTQLKTINPVWNKDMKFKVNDVLSDIQFMIYDEDLKKSGSDMEFLGKVSEFCDTLLSFSPMTAQFATQWLQGCGIRINLHT